jgi:hypothetical protein
MLGVGGLFYALPPALSLGPDWLVLVLMATFQAFAILLHRVRHYQAAHFEGFLSLSVGTLALLAALVLLVQGLPAKRETPIELMKAAAALWISNILVFASWYWRLDAGGPHRRDLRESHTDGAFLFPQMSLSDQLQSELGLENWRPRFVDYLFLAFNTSTAFSPTDVPVLSPWAKVLMMVQAAISLATLAILAARAINVL